MSARNTARISNIRISNIQHHPISSSPMPGPARHSYARAIILHDIGAEPNRAVCSWLTLSEGRSIYRPVDDLSLSR